MFESSTVTVDRVELENLIALAYELVATVERTTIEELRKINHPDVKIIDAVAEAVCRG